jgi:PAS domain S-box-containing protein
MAKRNPGAYEKAKQRSFKPPTAAELAEIVQIFDDAILVVDESQQIIFINHAAAQMFGYRRAEILGQRLHRLFPDPHYDWIRQLAVQIQPPSTAQRQQALRHSLVGRRQDGCSFPVEIAIAPLGLQGRTLLTIIIRNLTTCEVAAHEQQLKLDALENSSIAFAMFGREGKIIYANATYLKLWGYHNLNEILGASVANHCNDLATLGQIIDRVDRQGQHTIECTARRQDGSNFEIMMSVQKSIDTQGNEIYLATAIDITQRKQAEARLANQKDLLETILQQAADAIVVCDAQDKPILINAAARRLALEDSKDHPDSSPKYLWGKGYYPDGHPIPLQAWPLQQALRGNTTIGAEARVIRPDNSYYDVLISAAPIHNDLQKIMGAVAIFSDITERKRVEEKLLYQLRLTQGITDSATESIFVTDAKGAVTFLNPEALKVFGFTAEEIIGKPLHNTIHHHYPDGRPIPLDGCRLGRTYTLGEHIRDHEDLFQRKDGTVLIMLCSSAPLENKGKRLGAVFFLRDVTARRQSEQALQESAARLRAIINAVPDLLLVLDQEGRHLEILSHPQLPSSDLDKLKGRLIRDFLPEANTKLILKAIQDTLANRQPQSFEHEITLPKRGKQHFEVRTAPLDGLLLGKPAVVLLARDATQHRLTESSLRHAQKMEAVGQLTGGIAHDFNNLLAIMLGNLELLAEALTEPDLSELVQRALGAVERGTTLVRRLLTFSRQQPLQPVPLNLNTLVAGLSDLMLRSLGETIKVDIKLVSNPLLTLIDPGEFEAALLNLVVNARDAMPKGGRLTLETANRWLGKETEDAQFLGAEPGQYIMLAVSDTGTGMSSEVLEHAFEPFFTTKEVGQGNGLGLSMVYGLVKQSGGHIQIISEVDQGTTIRIFLPAATAKISVNPSFEDNPTTPYPGQGQTILVVEDELQVRRLAVHMLESLGYETMEAETAATAFVLLENTPRIVVLFTDVVLPGGQSGVDLAQKALQLRPDLLVLFTSGYAETHLLNFKSCPLGSDFLSKPYRKTELAEKLHALLTPKDSPSS